MNEWFNLLILYGKANVPAIYRVNEKETTLYKNLVLGEIVRDVLVRAGAKIMHMQTDHDPELGGMSKVDRLATIVARGTAVISNCLTEKFLVEMEDQINTIHSYDITKITPTFGNVIIGAINKKPYFIDLKVRNTAPVGVSFFIISVTATVKTLIEDLIEKYLLK